MPPAGQCNFSQAAFTAPAARPRFEQPALASVPDGLVSAWRDDRDVDFGLYSQRLDAQAVAVEGEQRLVAGNGPDSKLSLARAGDALALAWSDQKSVHVSLLDLQGALVSPDIWLSAPANFTQAPRLAVAGQGWGLVWYEGPGQSASTSRFVLVDPAGGASEPLVLAPDSPSAREPQICSNGKRFGVTWTDRRADRDEVWFRIIDLEGASVGSERRVGFVEGGQASEATIACLEDGFAIAWNEAEKATLGVRLQQLDAEGNAVGKASAWPGILSALGLAGRELQLLRFEADAGALWLERLANGAGVSQRLVEAFGGNALFVPLVAQPGRSYVAWSQSERLQAGSIDCP